MDRYLSDETSSWHQEQDGTWTRVHKDAEGNRLMDIQEYLLKTRSRRGTPNA